MPPKKKPSKISFSIEMDPDKADEAAAFRLSQMLKPEAITPVLKPLVVRKINALGKQLLDSCSNSAPEEKAAPTPDESRQTES